MKKSLFVLVVTLSVAIAVPAFAQDIKLSGPHYTLNIIGVEKGKTVPMIDSNRHTIFVALGTKGADTGVITNIMLQPGYDFQVCDGNGFDAAYDCSGNLFKSYNGATFQLPCNTTLSYDVDYGCPVDVAQRSYMVYARALGTPGGSADMTTCAYDELGEKFCSLEVLTLSRNAGPSKWTDATAKLTSIYYDIDADGTNERIALFSDAFEDYFWQYDNKGLKLAQIRFYPLPAAE